MFIFFNWFGMVTSNAWVGWDGCPFGRAVPWWQFPAVAIVWYICSCCIVDGSKDGLSSSMGTRDYPKQVDDYIYIYYMNPRALNVSCLVKRFSWVGIWFGLESGFVSGSSSFIFVWIPPVNQFDRGVIQHPLTKRINSCPRVSLTYDFITLQTY